MKDVAVVRDVVFDAIANVNGIIKPYEEIKKVEELKLRVVDPVFKKDLFTIRCKEKEGILVPTEFTYTPPEKLEDNNLTKPFPKMDKIRAKVRKYIKKEVKLQFEGAESVLFERTIESFLFNHNLRMYGDELIVSLIGLEGYVLALPELQSNVGVNITKTMVW